MPQRNEQFFLPQGLWEGFLEEAPGELGFDRSTTSHNNPKCGEITAGRGKTVYEGTDQYEKQAHLEVGGE